MATNRGPFPWSVRRVGLDFEWTPPYQSPELAVALHWHFPHVATTEERVRLALETTFGGDASTLIPVSPASAPIDVTRTASPIERPSSTASAPGVLRLRHSGSRRSLSSTLSPAEERRRYRGYACKEHQKRKQRCDPMTCPRNGLYSAQQAVLAREQDRRSTVVREPDDRSTIPTPGPLMSPLTWPQTHGTVHEQWGPQMADFNPGQSMDVYSPQQLYSYPPHIAHGGHQAPHVGIPGGDPGSSSLQQSPVSMPFSSESATQQNQYDPRYLHSNRTISYQAGPSSAPWTLPSNDVFQSFPGMTPAGIQTYATPEAGPSTGYRQMTAQEQFVQSPMSKSHDPYLIASPMDWPLPDTEKGDTEADVDDDVVGKMRGLDIEGNESPRHGGRRMSSFVGRKWSALSKRVPRLLRTSSFPM